MKISCCWMYAIGKYGFPPPTQAMLQAIEEMARMGFQYIELEGVGNENLTAVIENRQQLRQACQDAGVAVANFAPLLPDVISLDPVRQAEALQLFARGVETAAYLDAAFVWIDSYTPPFAIIAGKALTAEIHFGEQWRIRIPEDFNWPAFWRHFVQAIKHCARIAKAHGLNLVDVVMR